MAGEVEKLLNLLDERLKQHNENRREVQNELLEVLCPEIKKDADSLEEKICDELTKNTKSTKRKSSVSSKSSIRGKATWMLS